MKFKDTEIKEPILRAVADLDFKEMTSIQEAVIPPALKGQDIVGQAPTGSGKTAAFAIPLVQNTDHSRGVEALVLAPTRELAIQISRDMRAISRYEDVKVATVYGGASINEQVKRIKHSRIVVGTPGRVLDHLRRGTLNLRGVKSLVLDEADRMLDMGFIKDIEAIIKKTPRKRQTLLFSATIPGPIKGLSKRFMRQPLYFTKGGEREKPKISHSFIEVENKEKFQLLLAILEKEKVESSIIFVNTKKMADILYNNLKKHSIEAEAIHGDLTQPRREKIMQEFRGGKFKHLVATDVAARGLDIQGVSHIINYDIPANGDDYTHRVGRTARAGKEGRAICILAPEGHDNMRNVHSEHLEVELEELPDFDPQAYPPIDMRLRSVRRKPFKGKGGRKFPNKKFKKKSRR